MVILEAVQKLSPPDQIALPFEKWISSVSLNESTVASSTQDETQYNDDEKHSSSSPSSTHSSLTSPPLPLPLMPFVLSFPSLRALRAKLKVPWQAPSESPPERNRSRRPSRLSALRTLFKTVFLLLFLEAPVVALRMGLYTSAWILRKTKYREGIFVKTIERVHTWLACRFESSRLHSIQKYLMNLSTLVCSSFLCSKSQCRTDLVQQTVEKATDGRVKVWRYEVVTKDGYLLILHRLVAQEGLNDVDRGSPTTSRPRRVIFFIHALLESSFNWVVSGPQSLPISLLEDGYDVWLGNNRGNLFSTPPQDTSQVFCPCITCKSFGYDSVWRHILPSYLYAYCGNAREQAVLQGNWNLYTMTQYDIPAFLSCIHNVTKTAHIDLVGVSQGAAQLLLHTLRTSDGDSDDDGHCSELRPSPVLDRCLRSVVASTSISSYRLICLSLPLIFHKERPKDLWLRRLTHLAKVWLTPGSNLIFIGEWILPTRLLAAVCAQLVGRFLHFYTTRLDPNYAGTIYKHTPSGATSLQNMRLLISKLETGGRLDVGRTGEERRGGRTAGLEVWAFFGGNDNLVDAEQSAAYLSELTSNRAKILLHPDFAHLDLHWGSDRPSDFYPGIRGILRAPLPRDCEAESDHFSTQEFEKHGWVCVSCKGS